MAKIRVSEDGLTQMVRGLLKDDYANASAEYSLSDSIH
jgi:hypothetical protein